MARSRTRNSGILVLAVAVLAVVVTGAIVLYVRTTQPGYSGTVTSICGQTMSSGGIAPPSLNIWDQTHRPIAHLHGSTILRLSRGCWDGSRVTYRPARNIRVELLAHTHDGQTAAALVFVLPGKQVKVNAYHGTSVVGTVTLAG